MFTGIIEEVGTIERIEKRDEGARIRISASLVTEDTKEGDSIAVNGVCLTALEVTPNGFSADVSYETLKRTTFSKIKVGAKVNLERSVTLQTRLGGHIVLGHVDCLGKIVSIKENGDFWTIKISYPEQIKPYLVYKGSIAVEGISLTIADLDENTFEVAIIPKTWTLTNLHTLKAGDEVNLEADIIAKYVERFLSCREIPHHTSA
ncbi:MAG: riboflavin synthase [Acidobacteria bacterium]|jgi:riboflavin synthase|nr:MAG: riboflavin synthase [Acidobacteriota bacterium]GIU81903.1 MAG: putative riboflavin synthase alpha chain [Pyrinomonadaceae bacterium]